MATTTGDDVTVSGTDHRYQGMADSFIAANTVQRDGLVKLSLDSMGALSQTFAAMNQLTNQWLGQIAQIMPAITANAISLIGAVGADDALEFVKVGASLSNSASPPTPGYQNLGTSGPGQGSGGSSPVNLPGKGTLTV